MTTKQAKRQNTGSYASNGAKKELPNFVSCELSDEQKAHCKAHVLPLEKVFDTVDAWVRGGFKLSFRYEERSLAIAAWLTGPEKDSPCSGLVLSARGPSLIGAITVLAYKHFEVLAEDWSDSDVQGAKRDSWG